MLTETRPIHRQILTLLVHLGMEKAHFAAKVRTDWEALVEYHPAAVASLAR